MLIDDNTSTYYSHLAPQPPREGLVDEAVLLLRGQLGTAGRQAALVQGLQEIAHELMRVFLPSHTELLGEGAEILDQLTGGDTPPGRLERLPDVTLEGAQSAESRDAAWRDLRGLGLVVADIERFSSSREGTRKLPESTRPLSIHF